MKLDVGERGWTFGARRIIMVVGGSRSYIWIGNDDENGNKACFGTISVKKLELMLKLARGRKT